MILEALFLSYEQVTTLLEYNYLLAPQLLAQMKASTFQVNLTDLILAILLYGDYKQLQYPIRAMSEVKLMMQKGKTHLLPGRFPEKGGLDGYPTDVGRFPFWEEAEIRRDSSPKQHYSPKVHQILNTLK